MNRHSVIASLIVILLFACRDRDDHLLPEIEGQWRKLVPAHPPTEYDFRAGIMTQATYFGAQPVATIQRIYAVRGDTLHIGGDLGDPQRRYVLRFLGSEVVEVTPVPGDTLALTGGVAYWERL